MHRGFEIVVVTSAGRRRYTDLLTYYTRSCPLIDRHELWMNTDDGEDLKAAERYVADSPEFFVKVESPMPYGEDLGGARLASFWKQLEVRPNTIYIRFDDDIVWMAEDAVRRLLDFRIDHPEFFLVFANTLNNSLCSHLHQRLGLLPAAPFLEYTCCGEHSWKRWQTADEVHRRFFEAMEEGELDRFKFPSWELMEYERFSINCMAWFGSDNGEIRNRMTDHEEICLTEEIPRQLGRRNVIAGEALVSHFAYYPQRDALEANTRWLERYWELAGMVYCEDSKDAKEEGRDVSPTEAVGEGEEWGRGTAVVDGGMECGEEGDRFHHRRSMGRERFLILARTWGPAAEHLVEVLAPLGRVEVVVDEVDEEVTEGGGGMFADRIVRTPYVRIPDEEAGGFGGVHSGSGVFPWISAWSRALCRVAKTFDESEAVWFVEDDVAGDPESFAKLVKVTVERGVDFAAMEVRRYEEDPEWPNWSYAEPFFHRPARSFSPLCRVSGKLMKEVLAFQRKHGRCAFTEVMFASVAREAGMSWMSWADDPALRRCFGRFRYRPEVDEPMPGISHPVKRSEVHRAICRGEIQPEVGGEAPGVLRGRRDTRATLVVARYREDLAWLVRVPEEIEVVIYNKGPEITNREVLERAQRIETRPNVGREAETYLHHLIGENGGGVTIFCQGEPFSHSPDFIELLGCRERWNEVQPLTDRWISNRAVPPRLLLNEECGEWLAGLRVRTELFSLHHLDPLRFHDPGAIQVGEEYRRCHGLEPGENVIAHFLELAGWNERAEEARSADFGRFCYGAIFAVDEAAVDEAAVKRVPREVLERLHELSRGHYIHAYMFERLWLHLFGLPFHAAVRDQHVEGVAQDRAQLLGAEGSRFATPSGSPAA